MRTYAAILVLSYFILQHAFSQTVTRGPYLQSLTPTSIKIKWRTDIATNSRVYYGTDMANLNLYEDVAASVTNHTVKLSNLQPYTTYYYSVGSTTQVLSGPSVLHYFKTAPAPGTLQPYRFWAIGDFGKDNQNQRDVLNSYLTYTGTTHTDIWLWLGDNAYDNGTDAQFQTKVFDVYKDNMKYMPFYPCPGNHDYESVCAIPCFSNPTGHSGPYFDIVDVPVNGEAGGVPSGYELYYSFDYGNVHFISLNSELGSLLPNYDWNGVYSSGNFNSNPVRQWLINDLNANTKPWVIAYFHQVPHTKGSHDSDNPIEIYMKAMRENYCPILEQYGVDIVLAGHSHVYERSFLLKGFYGTTSSFNNSYKVSGTSGKYSLGEAYVKYTNGQNANVGTVYVVQGNSGSIEPGAALNHPAMYYGDDDCGSFIIDVNGMRLDGKYLRRDGTIQDEFTILKTPMTVISDVNVTICSGQSYFAGGANQTTSGTYYDTIPSASGPDTVRATHLTVPPPVTVNVSVSICQGSSYFAGGGYQTTAGTYTDNYTTAAGCDSTVVTQLSVLPQLQETVSVSVCAGDSFFAGGAFQTAAGVYIDTLTASGGCDSILITALSLMDSFQVNLSAQICEGESYFAGGANQTQSGIYRDILVSSGGCDSIVFTNLTVLPVPVPPDIIQQGNLLSVPSGFAAYQWYKDNTLLSGANLPSLLATADGDYYVKISDANGCSAYSDTVTVVIIGIRQPEFIKTELLPNPITHDVLFSFSNIISGSLQIDVFNSLGKKVMSEYEPSFHDDKIRLPMAHLNSGVYLIKVWNESVGFTGRVVKQ